MILVDTSIWVKHFREGYAKLEHVLNDGDVVCHPFIIGELACGHLKNRNEIIHLLQALPKTKHATHEEILDFIEKNNLMGKGIGIVDCHLLASALLSNVVIWSFDTKLNSVAKLLKVDRLDR